MKKNFTEKLEKTVVNDAVEYLLNLTKPVLDTFLNEIYPYIYLSILLVSISFLLILGIFFLLLRNHSITLDLTGNKVQPEII